MDWCCSTRTSACCGQRSSGPTNAAQSCCPKSKSASGDPSSHNDAGPHPRQDLRSPPCTGCKSLNLKRLNGLQPGYCRRMDNFVTGYSGLAVRQNQKKLALSPRIVKTVEGRDV